MKKIIFTFLSCFMLAASLPVESFAAAVVDSALPNSRRYTGVMQDLVRENRDRRKAFNKQEQTMQNTGKIDAILKDRKRVSTRLASDSEKDDILKLIMATVITDPHTLSTKMTTNLDVAKSSSDPLDRHSYIVDMAGSFAHELITTGKIENERDFSTFQRFSGVDKDRFLKLFYQVKKNHRRGFKVQENIEEFKRDLQNRKGEIDKVYEYDLAINNMYPSNNLKIRTIAMQTLVDIAKAKSHPHQADAVQTLMYVLVIEKNLDIFNTAKEALRSVATNSNNSLHPYALRWFKYVKGAENLDIPLKTVQFLNAIAQENSNPLQEGALEKLCDIAIYVADESICMETLDALITIANSKDHPQQDMAIWTLGLCGTNSEYTKIRTKALDALITIADAAQPGQSDSVNQLTNVAAQGRNKKTRKDALNALLQIAINDDHSQQTNSLKYIIKISKYKKTRQKALEDLITIANTDSHSQQANALLRLSDVVINEENDEEIRNTARQALIATRDNAAKR